MPTFPFPALRFAGLSFYRSGRWGLGGSGGRWGGAGGGAGRNGGGGGGGGGRNAQERWVRELEEETGALARGAAASGVGTGASTSLAGGSAGLVARAGGSSASASGSGGGGNGDDARRVLPAFLLCTYEEFLRTCARDARIGCVVLVSAEHDAVAAFKRCVSFLLLFLLPSSSILKPLQQNNARRPILRAPAR